MKRYSSVMAAIVFLLVISIKLEAVCPRPLVVILMGPPASGKGTQAAILTKEFGIPAISTGELLRENIRAQTALGLEAKSYIDQGKLVPDDKVLAMLFERIAEADAQKGYLLDGFPRTLEQAKAYEKHVGSSVVLLAINIDIPDNLLYERVIERAKIQNRSDDTPAILEERLKNYRMQTEPLLAYYEKENILYRVDGRKPVEKITTEMKAFIQAARQKEGLLCQK